MKRVILLFASVLLLSLESLSAPARFQQPDPKALPGVFMWTDTCNVYVLREGEAAMLIDLGDGSVLDHLGEIGVKRVEWVLFTHHHREQCQGYPKLQKWGAKVAGPEAERALFERPTDFRKMKVRLGDAFTIHGSSYVRPPIQPIRLDKGFKRMDTFTWGGYEFWCVDTRGNSPGAMSYMLRRGEVWYGFTGDLMMRRARMHTWFDTEWDYGFAAGIWALCNSAGQVVGYNAKALFPSHGPTVLNPAKELAEYHEKLFKLERLYVRGYPVSSFAGAVQDKVSRPSKMPHFWQVSPHIFKFRGPEGFGNFYLLLAESGKALVVDCGLLDTKVLDAALEGMRQHYGLKSIEAVVITHMHGDHFLQVPHLREKWGAQAWALENMGPVCEHPEWFDYAAPIQAYGDGFNGLRMDRLFKAGERFDWEGYRLTVDWMPGQTEFALCLHGTMDGRKVAFTGDNLFGDPDDPQQNGHEAMVAHNSAILEEGYIYAAEYLRKLEPDILLGGHSYVMDRPGKFIERFRQWSYDMREAFAELSSEEDYEYWFDPFWVRAEPCRLSVKAGGSVETQLRVRNFQRGRQEHRIEVHTPPGLSVERAVFEGTLKGEQRGAFPLRIHASSEAKPGVHIVAFDVTLDGRRYGEIFDCTVEVTP